MPGKQCNIDSFFKTNIKSISKSDSPESIKSMNRQNSGSNIGGKPIAAVRPQISPLFCKKKTENEAKVNSNLNKNKER